MLQRAVRGAVLITTCALVLSGCSLPWQKTPLSGIQITTEGTPAKVLLNGNPQGSTPFLHQGLSPGRYAIKLEPEDPNMLAYETTVELSEGTLTVVSWQFAPTAEESAGVIYEMKSGNVRGETSLAISTQPDGAIISIDDASEGFAPVLLKDITPGAHNFFISLPGYKELKQSVQVVENFQMIVRVKLSREVSAIAESDAETASLSASMQTKPASASATPKKTTTPTPTKTATSSASKSSDSTASQGNLTIIETGTGWLRVREKPSAAATELTKVDVGKSFPYSAKESGWYEIEYETGKKGWVSGQYVKTE